MTTRVYSWAADGQDVTGLTVGWGDRRPYPGNILVALISFTATGGVMSDIVPPKGWTELSLFTGPTEISVGCWYKQASSYENDDFFVTTENGTDVSNAVVQIVELDRAALKPAIVDYSLGGGITTPGASQDTGVLTYEDNLTPVYSFCWGEGDVWEPGKAQAPTDFVLVDGYEAGDPVVSSINFAENKTIGPKGTTFVWEAANATVGGYSFANAILFALADSTLIPTADYRSRQPGRLVRDYRFDVATITPPAEPLFTLAEAREWLRLGNCAGGPTPDDALIELLITAVRDELDGPDGILGRCLQRRSLRLFLDGFPPCGTGPIRLPFTSARTVGDVISTPIHYVNTAGELTRFTGFEMLTNEDPNLLVPSRGETWPTDVACQPRAVEIVYEAGYETIPEILKTYAKLRLGQLYEFRELVIAGTIVATVPHLQSVIEPFRALWYHPFGD